jgi:predicted permease
MITKMLEAEYRVTPIRELWVSGQKEGLSILGIAVALVLVASLLNIAGLWLARWFGRGHELAIQSALGGDRRLALIGAALEYALLAVPGLLLALLVAGGVMRMLYVLDVVQRNGPLIVTLGGSTALIGLILVLVSAVPVLIALAWQARGMARTSVRFLTGGGVAARGRGARLRQALMIGQIGIACSLLVVLGLLLSSWINLMREDLGFARDKLVVAQILSPEPEFPQPDQRVASVAERIRGLPGVERVSWALVVPFGRMEMLSSISLNSETEDHQVPARPRPIGPDYFSVAGITLLQGRAFGPEDEAGEVQNVIVDRLFADKYMGGEAMDKQFSRSSGPSSYEQVNIVGVVETVRHMSPGEELSTPTVYTYMPEPLSEVQLLVRSGVPPESLVNPIRSAITGELGEDRAGFITSMNALVRRTVRDREPQLALLATFAGLALVLMFYGLYALQSYQVTARTAEFGMRKAMGATAKHMFALVLKSALWLLPLGMALGLVGGLLGARLVAERLYSVSPANPLLWIAVLVAITLVMIVGVLVPAFRAVRITPMEALRYE